MKQTTPSVPLLVALVLLSSGAAAQQRLVAELATTAAEAVFVYTDVENFLAAHRAAATADDRAAVYRERYIERGTPGLQIFIEKYGLTAEKLVAAIDKHRDDYARLPEVLAALREEEPSYRRAYAKIAQRIEGAVFPPTYFLIGAHRGIGSGSIHGPLVTIEKDSVESVRGDLVATLVHEMIHMEQLAAQKERYFDIFSGPGRTLLAVSLREGAAMYFSDLITGRSEHKTAAWDYLLANEEAVWERFQAEMHGAETGDWLYEQPRDPETPQDVGYALGARITQAFYESADDKRRAAAEIMAVTDYREFLRRSGYRGGRGAESG